MKIGFFISQIMYGGAEMVLVNLANEFKDRGLDVVLITTIRMSEEPSLRNGIVRYVLNEEEKNRIIPNSVSNQYILKKIVRTNNLDVLVSFMGGALFHGVLATLGTKTKSIISIRNDPDATFNTKKKAFLARTILPMASYCVFQTEQAQNWFPERLRKKSVVIPNGIKSIFFNAEYKPKKRTILTCGRLEAQKNHKLLISAIKNVVKKYTDVKLVVVGEGSLKEELKSYVNELGLTSNIDFVGTTTNVVDYYSTADLFVLSSDYEGIPNVLLEALAVGVPAISTDCPCGGPHMIIEGGVNGILVPVSDVAAMTKAIECLFDNEQLKRELANNAKISVKKYEFKEIANRWIKVVNEVAMKRSFLDNSSTENPGKSD